MGKKLLLLSVVFVVAILCGSTALAVAPVGPPTAGLKTGQFSAGFGYAHGEIDSADVDWKSDFASGLPKLKAKDVKSDAYLAKFGYGISDDWEFYGFLGVADMRGKIDDDGFDGDQDFSGGFGTKYTFLRDGQLSWGGVYQMSWSRGDDSYSVDSSDYGLDYGTVKIDSDFKMYDIFLAVGPTYEMKNWRIYGGAGLHYFNADVDVKYTDITILEGDADKASFGGYAGTEIDLDARTSIYGEYMLAGDAWALGTGIVWKF
jgi:opacity protein-like surface antigen